MTNCCQGEIVFVTVIAERKLKDALLVALLEADMKLINTSYGHGTVKSGMLQNTLGFVHEKNRVVISCLSNIREADCMLAMLREKFRFDEPNTGIAFTVPVEKLAF